MGKAKTQLAKIPAAIQLAEDPAYAQAKTLYFSHANLTDVSRATGLSIKVLRNWKLKEGWDAEREDEDRSTIETAFGARKVSLAKVTKISSDQLLRGLEHLAKRLDPPTLDEMQKLAMILGSLDKVSRLDSNQSTENVSVITKIQMTAEEIRKALTSDPFFTEIAPPTDE